MPNPNELQRMLLDNATYGESELSKQENIKHLEHVVNKLREGDISHPETDRCGFDRNASISEDRYVCDCGWMEPLQEELFMNEKDPLGKQKGEPGAKLDAGKPSVTRGCLHYFPLALTSVAELSTKGAAKYSWRGWESVPDGINRYADALGRHELAIAGDYTARDPDSGVLEATAVAWNALARLELILREGKK